MRTLTARPKRLDSSDPDKLRRDLGRLVGDIDELIFALGQVYAPRWQPGDRYTANSTRPRLQWGRLHVIDSRDGDVRLYLPEATPRHEGWACGFVKQIPTGSVHLNPVAGQTINGYTSWEGLGQVGFHYAIWTGSEWWIREPTARVRPHVNTADTVGLWQLTARSLADTSGNGRDLSLETGTTRFNYISGTLGGLYGDGSSAWIVSAFDATLHGLTDFTAMWLNVQHAVTAGAYWFSHTAAGELEAQNQQYGVGYNSVSAPGGVFIQENGAGTDSTATQASFAPMNILAHLAVTRTSNVIQFYVMGRTFGSPSAALTAPTGGTDGRFRLFGNAATRMNCTIASFQLIDRALSAAEIMAARNYTLGGAQGYIDDF